MSDAENILELRNRGFDFIKGGNSASYILRVFQDATDKIKALEAELSEARKVIEFYGDGIGFSSDMGKTIHGLVIGKRAREFLAKHPVST